MSWLKKKAEEITKAYNAEDQFQILSHDFEGRHQRFVNRDDALNLIAEINPSPNVRDLSQVIDRQNLLFKQEEVKNRISYLITDFQESITNIKSSDTLMDLRLLPLQAIQERNISIDSCWLEAPAPMLNQTNSLVVQMTNHANQSSDQVRLSFDQNGQNKPLGTYDFKANETIIDTVNITISKAGWFEGILKITDYPIQFDDQYFISLFLAEKINILSINEAAVNRYLTAAFDGLNYFNLDHKRSDQLVYNEFPSYDLIILNDLSQISSGLSNSLRDYISAGGNVLMFPGISAEKEEYNSFLSACNANIILQKEIQKRQVGKINTEEFIFKDVFEKLDLQINLPSTSLNYGFSSYQNRRHEKILNYRDGSSFLFKSKFDLGHLYVCTAPLDAEKNDLVLNAEIFIPMLYKMAVSTGQKTQIAYTIGTDNIIQTEKLTGGTDQIYEIISAQQSTANAISFIPQQTNIGNSVLLDLGDQISKSGFYQLRLGDEIISKLAFNYNNKESSLLTVNPEELEERYGHIADILREQQNADFSQIISEKERGKFLWKWCLIFCLVFLGIEQLLLRFWKT